MSKYDVLLKMIREENSGMFFIETELKKELEVEKEIRTVVLPLSKELGESLIDYFEEMLKFLDDEKENNCVRFVKEDIEQYLEVMFIDKM